MSIRRYVINDEEDAIAFKDVVHYVGVLVIKAPAVLPKLTTVDGRLIIRCGAVMLPGLTTVRGSLSIGDPDTGELKLPDQPIVLNRLTSITDSLFLKAKGLTKPVTLAMLNSVGQSIFINKDVMLKTPRLIVVNSSPKFVLV